METIETYSYTACRCFFFEPDEKSESIMIRGYLCKSDMPTLSKYKAYDFYIDLKWDDLLLFRVFK